jgi:glycosyltransferase EpsE
MPKVSILTATYKRPQLLSRSIESARAQTFSDWELIIIDDVPEDKETEAVGRVWEARDGRIRYLKIPRLGHIAKVSNVGLGEAKGEYVAILDDDDAWREPDKLKKQIEFLDANPDYVGCGSGYVVVDDKGVERQRVRKPETWERIKDRALIANPMANSTTVFRVDAARHIGSYDETMVKFADWDFWLKMGKVGKLYNFPDYFVNYQMWLASASFSNQTENAASAIRIIQRHRKNYPHYPFALVVGLSYWIYAKNPDWVKRILNPILSRLKKALFSR